MIECLKFKAYPKGKLLGFADFYIPAYDMEILGCSVFSSDQKRMWVSFPCKEINDNDGRKYYPHLKFRSKEKMQKFSDLACEAVRPHLTSQPQSPEPNFEGCPF